MDGEWGTWLAAELGEVDRFPEAQSESFALRGFCGQLIRTGDLVRGVGIRRHVLVRPPEDDGSEQRLGEILFL